MKRRICAGPSRSGSAMLEFALLLPVLTFALVLGVDFARVFYYNQTLINCARNGAEYASDPASPLRNTYADYVQAALADGQSLSPALTASDISAAPANPLPGDNVAVTVTYEFSTITGYLGFSTVNLSQTVTMRVVQAVPD